ncbi:unnamed protein product [Merluccius merluccius]
MRAIVVVRKPCRRKNWQRARIGLTICTEGLKVWGLHLLLSLIRMTGRTKVDDLDMQWLSSECWQALCFHA